MLRKGMRATLQLIVVLVLIYLIPAAILHLIYGDSYGWLAGADRWRPDGAGGWVATGSPTEPMPTSESVVIPPLIEYLPVMLPGLVLGVYLLWPRKERSEAA